MTKSNFTSADDYTGIHLFNESDQKIPINADTVQQIAVHISNEEDCSFALIEVVFVGEDEITRINKEHLEHDYVTDIITFRYDEEAGNQAIEGTLYCCAQRIAEQAAEFDAAPASEFRRIVIHGLLHLAGYDDKSDETKAEMSEKEDYYLSIL